MLRYRLIIEPDDNGTLLVTSPDLPLVTYGKNEAEAYRNARDAIDSLICSMISAREPIPEPIYDDVVGQVSHYMSLQTELKIRLYQAMLATGATRAELAQRLSWNRESVDRLFRLDHNSRLDQIEQAFSALGRTVMIDVREAA